MLEQLSYVTRINAVDITEPIEVEVLHKSKYYYILMNKRRVFEITIPKSTRQIKLEIGNKIVLSSVEIIGSKGFVTTSFNFNLIN